MSFTGMVRQVCRTHCPATWDCTSSFFEKRKETVQNKPHPGVVPTAKRSFLKWFVFFSEMPGRLTLTDLVPSFRASLGFLFRLSGRTKNKMLQVNPKTKSKERERGVGLWKKNGSYLVDPASSHMLVSKIKPCMSKYKQLYTVKLRMAH